MPVPVQYVEDFYVYQLDFPLLAVNTSATRNIQIQADSDFKLVKLTHFSLSATSGSPPDFADAAPAVNVQITDSGSGRQLFSSPVSVAALFGDGRIPFILPVARIFKARSNVAVQAGNYSTTKDYTVQLSFIGTKIFKVG